MKGLQIHSAPLRIPWLIALILGASLSLIGCRTKSSPETEEESAAQTPVPVRVGTARTVTLEPTIELVGTLIAIPERSAEIACPIEGQIQTVQVVEGDRVEAGTALIQLDARTTEAAVSRSRAIVQERQAILDRLKNGPLPQEIAVARQESEKAQTALKPIRDQLAAVAPLKAKGEIANVRYQEMESNLQTAQAEAAIAKARLELIQAGPRPEKIAEAQAQLESTQAELKMAELNLSFCRLATPIDGIVTDLNAVQGAYVTSSETLARIIDLSELFAHVRLPGFCLGKIRPGMRAQLRMAQTDLPPLTGTVARLAGQADPDTGDVDMYISVTNMDDLLRPGLAVRANVSLPPVTDALAIPAKAVADREGTPLVTVIKDGQANEQEVVLGIQAGGLVQVTQGLAAGDVVAVEGGYGLPDGCPVRVLPEDNTFPP